MASCQGADAAFGRQIATAALPYIARNASRGTPSLIGMMFCCRSLTAQEQHDGYMIQGKLELSAKTLLPSSLSRTCSNASLQRSLHLLPVDQTMPHCQQS